MNNLVRIFHSNARMSAPTEHRERGFEWKLKILLNNIWYHTSLSAYFDELFPILKMKLETKYC